LLIRCSFRNNNRQAEIKELTTKGVIPAIWDVEKHPEKSLEARTFLIGRVAALINDVLPAQQIVDQMVSDAVKILQHGASLVSTKAKL
jgi:hypothetical protein